MTTSALRTVQLPVMQPSNRLRSLAEPPTPEPVALYALVVLTFVTHVPYVNVDTCVQCNTAWPCQQVRLAYRLREGF